MSYTNGTVNGTVTPVAKAKEAVRDTLTMDDLGFLLFSHSAFQYLYAGCELGLFPLLNRRPNLSVAGIAEELDLEYRPARCLLFGLTALKLVIKDGETYCNSHVIENLFADTQWKIFHDTARFEALICYDGQGDLVESLRRNTNIGLRRIPGQGPDLYHRFSEDEQLQKVFYDYMGSWSELANPLLIENVDFSDVHNALDIGGGDATNAIAIARANPHLRITLLDLAENCEVARRKIDDAGLADQISVYEANMFTDDFPSGYDCFLFIHQLVIWPLETNTALLQRAYDALEPGGKVIIFNSISNDEEDGPVIAALDTVYFLTIPAEGGMIYPWKDYEQCLRQAGFSHIQRIRGKSWTPHGVIVATK
jgi:ubiquinone/menaquinone biosynthesis C-methylase UbiE